MKKITAIAAVIVSILLATVFASGCVGQRIAEKVTEQAIEKAIEKESGQDVEIDLDEGEISIESDEGEVSISADEETVEIKSDEGEATFGTGADLPEGFPSEVPVYDNMDITSSMGGSGEDGKKSYTVTGLSGDSVDDVKQWYESRLAGWEITSQFSMDTDDGSTASIGAESSNYELNVMIAEDEDGTIVVIGVAER